jgi:hypothetical protein
LPFNDVYQFHQFALLSLLNTFAESVSMEAGLFSQALSNLIVRQVRNTSKLFSGKENLPLACEVFVDF